MKKDALPPPQAHPDVRQIVTLDLSGLERLGARVEEVSEGALVLALFTEPSTPIQVLAFKDATLEFTSPRGLVRLTGAASPNGPSELRFQLDGEAEVLQRRQFARVDAVQPVSVTLNPDAGESVDTYTINLSGNGVLLASGADALKLGQVVWFELKLADTNEPVAASGRIVRETAEGYKGVEIDRIEPRDRELLVHFVFDRQRIARKMTRDG
jgi:hypothetical protein